MKKLLLTGLAFTAGLLAGQADAAIPNVPVPLTGTTPNWSAITTAQITAGQTFVAGSSAATPFLENALKSQCNGNIYKYSAGGASLLYLCSNKVAGSDFLVVHKRDGGGSINGVKSAATAGFNNQFVDLATVPSVTGCAALPAPNAQIFSCTGGTVAVEPAAAAHHSELDLADVDAAKFNFAINGGSANTAAGVANTPVATQIFGVAVNTLLRNAMQTAMIAKGLLPGCTVGSETEACMPSLTKAQLSTIFAKNGFSDWSLLAVSPTDANVTGYLFPTSATDPGNTNIHICGRTAGSGTWATMNVKFENAPCFGGAEAYINPTAQASTTGAGSPHAETNATSGAQKIMHAMSGSGDVESCLVGLNNAAATGTFNPYPAVLNDAAAAPGASNARWAIGVLGVERNASGALPYRFIKIDGYAPSAHNVAEGKYGFWAQLVSLTGPGLTAVTDPLAQRLLAEMSDPVQIRNLNVTQTWGGIVTNGNNNGLTGFLGEANNPVIAQRPTGFAADPAGNPLLLNAAFDTLRPVNPYSHQLATTGSDLDHCRVPTIPNGNGRIMPAFY